MQTQKTKLQECLSTVKNVVDNYKLYHIGSDSTERSVDNLIFTCSTYLDKKIEKLELDLTKEESPVYGSCLVFPDGNYVICFVNNLNYCWKRFVICKEVFHAVLDDEICHNMDIGSFIDEVMLSLPESMLLFSDPNWKASPSATLEMLAEIAAMEFMFPYDSRLAEINGIEDRVNYLEIAEKHKIPQVMVERYLSKTYISFLSP
jgi:Zn-dependent peptidase ImmA (M78 family)